MTIQVKGLEDVQRYIREAPNRIKRVLHGGGRAGGNVIAEAAKADAPVDATRNAMYVDVVAESGRIRVRIDVKPGWGRSVAIWAEYGTTGHYISVDQGQSGGRTAGRVNRMAEEGILVINGKPVGKTVWHPGARQAPFLRPALDLRLNDAVRAAQAYIDQRVRDGALAAGPMDGDGE